jgi:hypothetical protein
MGPWSGRADGSCVWDVGVCMCCVICFARSIHVCRCVCEGGRHVQTLQSPHRQIDRLTD